MPFTALPSRTGVLSVSLESLGRGDGLEAEVLGAPLRGEGRKEGRI